MGGLPTAGVLTPPDNMFDSFLRYYISLVQDGRVPLRSQFEPKAIQRILPWLSIGRYVRPRVLIPTLVGSAIDEAVGVSLTGKNVFDILPQNAWAQYEHFYNTICEAPCVGRIRRSFISPYRRHAQMCSVYVPLRPESGTEVLLLGCSNICFKNYHSESVCMGGGACPVPEDHGEFARRTSPFNEMKFGKIIDVSFADFDLSQKAGHGASDGTPVVKWSTVIPVSNQHS